MKFRTMAAVGALMVGAPAFAQSNGGFQVGVTGGTLGVGPEIGYRAGGFGVRGNATFLSIDREIESDGVEYDGDLKLKSYGAMVDLYPTGGGFRISGGARINRNRIALVATPTEDVEIGDDVFTPAEIGRLTGRVEAKKLAPTLTVGYGGSASPGLKFGFDIGAMFQGRPRVRDLETTGTLANNAAFLAELERERDEIEDDIDKFKIYPILQLSLSYLFGARAPAYVEPAVMAPPPPPPAAPVATQTCPDGSVIMATDICPPPPPPPPPPAASPGERG